MTMDVLREIKIAEEKAEKIRSDARREANKRTDAARAEAEKLIAEAEEEARREATGTVAEVSRRAGELVAAEAETARREAAELEKSAAANTDEAVKMIFWEIVEKCQRA